MVMDSYDLRDKSVLVTGATGYLGSFMVRCLGQAGAIVYVNSRSLERCQRLVDQLREQDIDARCAVFDVTDGQAVEDFFAELIGPLHVLVNNAYSGGAGPIRNAQADQYRDSYDVTVTAAHTVLVAALPALQQAVAEGGDASVINVSSMYGLVIPDRKLYESEKSMNPPFYGAAKAALLHWSRYAAQEFAAQGIRVNSLSPGPFPSIETQTAQPEFISSLASKVPLGRVGHPDDLAGPLLLLASSASGFMTGSNLVVDGGWTSA